MRAPTLTTNWSSRTVEEFHADYGLGAEVQIIKGMQRIIQTEVRAYNIWFNSLPYYCRLGLRIWWTAHLMLVNLRHALIR